MALLQDSTVLWYHCCDNIVEQTKGLSWNVANGVTFRSSPIVSGLSTNSTSNDPILYAASGNYGAPKSTSWTFAFWASGLNTNNSSTVGAGWFNNTPLNN